MPPKINVPDLKHEMDRINKQHFYWTPESQFTDILLKSNTRYSSVKINTAMKE